MKSCWSTTELDTWDNPQLRNKRRLSRRCQAARGQPHDGASAAALITYPEVYEMQMHAIQRRPA
ncbi:MAG: hypothetical protein ACLSTO_06600 [Bilophila wadsworthia]